MGILDLSRPVNPREPMPEGFTWIGSLICGDSRFTCSWFLIIPSLLFSPKLTQPPSLPWLKPIKVHFFP